jgi:hypothetical protein
MLQESASAAPHQSVRDSIWVEFMLGTGISDEELELAKRVYAYSLEHLEIGSGVEVHGLQARPDLNAKHARVVAYVPERERYHVVILGTDKKVYLRRANLTKSAAAAPAMDFSYSLLSRGRGTVHAIGRREACTHIKANSGDASSQYELGYSHSLGAKRLDILQGAPADDHVVATRWAEALRFAEMAAEQGAGYANWNFSPNSQTRCGEIYAAGGRSVPQNWGHRGEMVAQGSRSRKFVCAVVHRAVLLLRARCASRRCAVDGVVQAVRGARKSCGLSSFTDGYSYPGIPGVSEYDCSFYECWLCASPTNRRARVCQDGR